MMLEMIKNHIALEYENNIIAFDKDNLFSEKTVIDFIKEAGFKISNYDNVEAFRYIFESQIKENDKRKYFIIVNSDIYIPYDIRQFFYLSIVDYDTLFPRFDSTVLRENRKLNLDLFCIAYNHLFQSKLNRYESEQFINNEIYQETFVKEYVRCKEYKIRSIIEHSSSYESWFKVSEVRASISKTALKSECEINLFKIDELISTHFNQFIFDKYGTLASRSYYNSPVLLNKVLDHIMLKNEKVALIVMDGMSVLDWQIIDESLEFKTTTNYSYAFVPTITSISRQSLLSGKLPVEHDKPFSLSNEKKQFTETMIEHGYKKDEIKYHRGYDFDIYRTDKFITTIINDIDDLVHNQIQGSQGLYSDIEMLINTRKISGLIYKLQSNDFQVFITSDHGNQMTTGIGKPKGLGIEVETKSQRMVIYKKYAELESIESDFKLREFESEYLPQNYKYLVCEDDSSIGKKGSTIISHGGISINEVIVPFIKVEGVLNE